MEQEYPFYNREKILSKNLKIEVKGNNDLLKVDVIRKSFTKAIDELISTRRLVHMSIFKMFNNKLKSIEMCFKIR